MPNPIRISRAEFERLWLVEHWGGQRIADHFGINRGSVTNLARGFGLPLRRARRVARWVIPASRSAELVHMWRARVKMADIARHFGCNNRTVENTVKRLGEGNRGKAAACTFLSLSDYLALKLARRMAADAEAIRTAFHAADMVDVSQAGQRLARRAA